MDDVFVFRKVTLYPRIRESIVYILSLYGVIGALSPGEGHIFPSDFYPSGSGPDFFSLSGFSS
jgi:hypothetical protein